MRGGVDALAVVFATGCALTTSTPGHAQHAANGQAPPGHARNTGAAEDPTLKRHYTVATIPLHIVLPPVSEAEKAALAPRSKDQPMQIGFGRPIPAARQGDLQPLLRWVPEADGTATAAVAVTSPGARALRVALAVGDLPAGIELRFFSLAQPAQVFGPFTARDLRQASKDANAPPTPYWSPVIEGETAGIELRRTQAAPPGGFVFTIVEVSHLV